MLIFNQVSDYRRRHGMPEHRASLLHDAGSLTYQLHKDGRRWSEISNRHGG
jgi:hypothetical protein